MTLRPATLATLEELREASWFAHLGTNLLNSGKISAPVVIVSSWDEAIEYCEEEEWDLALNESSNIFCEQLVRASKEEFKTWNEHVRAVREVSIPLVKSKLASVQEEHNLPPSVEDTLRWIVTMALTEAEYAHATEPGNHAKLAFWIVNGHFPCGWKGEFPNGNLIIY